MRAKTINEYEFHRGEEPKEAMNTGSWQQYENIIIPLEKFKEMGGVLTEGRELYDTKSVDLTQPRYIGEWIHYDESQRVDLMKNFNFKSTPIYPNAGVMVKCKILVE